MTVDLNRIEKEINEWTKSLGIHNKQGKRRRDQHLNAYAHAYASAVINYDSPQIVGRYVANILGNGRELKSFAEDSLKAIRGAPRYTLEGVWRDGHRDLFNNNVGVRMGDYARKNNIPREAIGYLVSDALNRGNLVSNEFDDPRVGLFNYSRPVYSGPSNAMKGQMFHMFGIGRDVK